MPDTNDLLVALRDVGVGSPARGDAGDEHVRSAVAREIAAPQRTPRPARMRRRRMLRLSVIGAAAAAAAGVLVATGTGGGSSPSRFAFGGMHGSRVGSVATEDTAYVVRRVRAKVAVAAQNGTVVRFATYNGGDVNSDGSLVNLGWKMDDGYEYAAPDGAQFARGTLYDQDGSTELTTFDQWAPGASEETGTDEETVVNPTTSQYSQTRYGGAFNPNSGPTPSLFSTPAQVQQALQSGQMTLQGTATIAGTPAIALSMVAPSAPDNPVTDIAVYVDARTYQPLRTVAVVDGAPDLEVSDWVPATSANVELAEDGSIPAGYTKTTPRQVDAGTYGK